jgi:hypothetical protein
MYDVDPWSEDRTEPCPHCLGGILLIQKDGTYECNRCDFGDRTKDEIERLKLYDSDR